jgi:hypothetical protein
MPFIKDKSITNPPLQTHVPAKPWAPPSTDTSKVVVSNEVDPSDDVGHPNGAGDQARPPVVIGVADL